MKKSIIITLLGLMALAACVREPGPGSNVAPVAPTTRLTINSADPGSKTYMEYDSDNDCYVPKWHKGDVVGAFVDSFDAGAAAAHGNLTNGGDDGASASFSGDVSALSDGNHTAYAFYPARAFYGTESGKVVNLEIPEIQFPSATSFDRKADILVGVPKVFTVTGGTADAIEDAQFRRVCAILKVTLVDQTGENLSAESVKSVRLDFASGQNVTGSFRYDFTNEDACDNHLVATIAKPNVTADYSGSPVAFNSNFFLLVNPGTYSGALTVTVLTDKHEIVKTVANIGTWELFSGKVRPVTVKLGNNTTVERVYFQDNFDWIANYWDGMVHTQNSVKTTYYTTAYKRNQYNLDPVLKKSTSGDSYHMPNVWSNNSTTVGTAFTNLGYVDLCPDNKTMYTQENYLKWCAGDKQSGLELPPMGLGEVPVNVTLSFDFAVQQAGCTYVVEVLKRGTCANSGAAVSNTFTASETYNWERQTLTLIGLTNASRICIRPNVSSYTTSGQYRFWLDNIKVTEAAVTPAPFPVEWSFLPPTQLVQEVDYHLEAGCLTGTYLFSDNHYGRILIRRAAGAVQVKDGNTIKNPTYLVRGSTDTFAGYTQLLTYGIGKDSAFEFELYNVDNPAGTYTIDFNITASGGGAKYFGIQYSTDEGSTWSQSQDVEDQIATEVGGSDLVDYSFALVGGNVRKDVHKTFHAGAIKCEKFLIRAVAVSRINQGGSDNVGVNSTATCRIFAMDSADDTTSKVYVGFEAD